jgi:transcriptional regulator of acetoin/glycerol metabolism
MSVLKGGWLAGFASSPDGCFGLQGFPLRHANIQMVMSSSGDGGFFVAVVGGIIPHVHVASELFSTACLEATNLWRSLPRCGCRSIPGRSAN